MACIPVAKFWDPTIAGTCINFNIFFLVNSIIETILDFVILVLPVPMILGLQLSRHNKVVLSGIFLLGGLYVLLSFEPMQMYTMADIH